jgi:hypothetical protein
MLVREVSVELSQFVFVSVQLYQCVSYFDLCLSSEHVIFAFAKH